LAALGLALATPAVAEPARIAQGAPDIMPPYEVLTIIRSTGLQPLDRPVRRGSTYVLRAIGRTGEEMRVVVDARYGDILSVTPTASASRAAPGVGARIGPYEPMDSDEDLEPIGPPGLYRANPPVIYEPETAPVYGPRPPAGVTAAPRAAQSVTPGPGPTPGSPGSSQAVITPEPGENGLLPPPPERFPQRAAPAPERKAPAPKRAAQATPAKQPPLPRPKPGAPGATTDAAPLPPPIPERKPEGDSVPH
jgi:hypothetical protein